MSLANSSSSSTRDINSAADEFIKSFYENLRTQTAGGVTEKKTKKKKQVKFVAAAESENGKLDNNEELKLQRNIQNTTAAAVKLRPAMVSSVSSGFGTDVDKSADEFISSFRRKLAIERRDSINRYQEMLRRGAQ